MQALGLIEAVGYTTAISAADAAVKAADVEIIGLERVIGVGGYVGVTVHLTGDVAAVASAVEAGRQQGETIGKIISTEVIPRAHSEVAEKLLSKYLGGDFAGTKVNASPAQNTQAESAAPEQKRKKTGIQKPDAEPAANEKEGPVNQTKTGTNDDSNGKKA